MSVFDLLEVQIGSEMMRARPIKWTGEKFDKEGLDENGKLVLPIEYESVCPKCGQLTTFLFSEIKDGKVSCKMCGAGPEEVKPSAPVDIKREPVEEPIIVIEGECPFQDPVAAGELKW